MGSPVIWGPGGIAKILAPNGLGHKVQTKYLSANVTGDGTMSDLTFTVTSGKFYLILANMRYAVSITASDATVQLEVTNGTTAFANGLFSVGGSTLGQTHQTLAIPWVADSTSIEFDALSVTSGDSYFSGTGDSLGSYVFVIEFQYPVEDVESF